MTKPMVLKRFVCPLTGDVIVASRDYAGATTVGAHRSRDYGPGIGVVKWYDEVRVKSEAWLGIFLERAGVTETKIHHCGGCSTDPRR